MLTYLYWNKRGASGIEFGTANAIRIAEEFEVYAKGMQGYILYQLANEGKQMKTVAVVTGYDANAGTYTIVGPNAEGQGAGASGIQRDVEGLQYVSKNLAGDAQVPVTGITKEQLASCDLVVVNAKAGSGVTTNDIVATFDPALKQKTYWVDSNRPQAGATYDPSGDSIECVQGMARELGCLYPEYLDQDELVYCYYTRFYHMRDDDVDLTINTAIENAMDGVRNWDATGSDLLEWTQADYSTDKSGYNGTTGRKNLLASVDSKLYLGVHYLLSTQSSQPMALHVTDSARSYVESNSFTDVDNSTPHAADIYWLTETGISTGYDNSDGSKSFGGMTPVYRQDMAAFLHRFYRVLM